MKKSISQGFILFFLFLLASLTSCVTSQSWVPVKGNGESEEKNYTVTDFHGIDVSGGFDVVLVQGPSDGLTLTAQKNLFEHITVKVDQGILKIYTENNIMATRPLKARITFRSIDNLKVSGGGDVTSETTIEVPDLDVSISGGGDYSTFVNTGKLNFHISGGGDAEINGSIKTYNVDLSGGGDIHSEIASGTVNCRISGGGDMTLLNKEKGTEADIDISGGGDLKVDMNMERLKISVSGGGDATLAGQASELELTINGGGDVFAADLAAGVVTFQVSGGSDVHVNASREITGHISGGGNVYYSGGAEKIDVDARGGSEIHKQ
jgi:hypothetical protein